MNHRILAALVGVSSVVACGKNDPAPASAAQANQSGAAAQEGGARGARAGGRGPGGGRGLSSITLASSDVALVKHGVIEEAVAIAGDLKPIESVDVKARLEGDLVGVYVREGQRVTRGQVLARFESSEEESGQQSAEADRAAAETDLATAQWNYDQSQELFKAGAISEQNLKVAQQAVAAARARLAAAEARLKSTSSVVRDTRVVAPTTGVVSARLVENGEHVARGASMFTVVRSDVLELAASVPARQANAVKVGQVVHFTADGRAIEGRVARVSPTIDPNTRSVAVYAQIPNPGGAIKGGTFATGRVVSRVIPGALKVPMAAVRQSQDNGQTYVYKIDGSTIDIAQLQLGVIDDRAGMAEVLSGLADGDRVVVGNVGALGRGMQVQILGNEGGPGRAGAGGGPRGTGGGSDRGRAGDGVRPANAR